MLPNFLIIGTQKAATTWLAKCFSKHPEIFIVNQKEIHFFNNNFDKGLGWYEAHFKNWSGESRIGEATPGYISNPHAPIRIERILGSNVKLIASLRDPVDRAYSAFWQLLRIGSIPANTDFRTLMLEGDDRFGLYNRGYYYAHLSRYLECFSRENLMILIYEEIGKDNKKTLSSCLEFLNVDPTFVPDVLTTRINQAKDLRRFHKQALGLRQSVISKVRPLPPKLQNFLRTTGRQAFEHLILKRLPKQSNYSPLAQEVRQELLHYFMPDITQLEQLLERDLSIWYTPSR